MDYRVQYTPLDFQTMHFCTPLLKIGTVYVSGSASILCPIPVWPVGIVGHPVPHVFFPVFPCCQSLVFPLFPVTHVNPSVPCLNHTSSAFAEPMSR